MLAGISAAEAQTSGELKTLTFLVGSSPGGGYDTYTRILARHLGKHIPGNPSVVVQNMPGAGSLKLTNYLYNIAPKDGSTIGIFSRGMAMEPLIGGTCSFVNRTSLTGIRLSCAVAVARLM